MTIVIISFVITAIVSYLIGSFNFSIIVSRAVTHEDVRTKGSGNAGATNVLRTSGKLPAAITFLADFLKTVIAILLVSLIAKLLNIDPFYIQFLNYTAGIGCLFGHIFPLYFGFKGGKGVTTFAAVVFMLDWRTFLICISIFIIVVLISRIVSLGSIIAVATVPVVTFAFQTFDNNPNALSHALLSLVIAFVIIMKHKTNILRLMAGEETKIGNKNKDKN